MTSFGKGIVTFLSLTFLSFLHAAESANQLTQTLPGKEADSDQSAELVTFPYSLGWQHPRKTALYFRIPA